MYYYGYGMEKAPPAHANGGFYSTNSIDKNFKSRTELSSNAIPYGNLKAIKSMSNFPTDHPVYFESYYELNQHQSGMFVQKEVYNGSTSLSKIKDNDQMESYQSSGIKPRPSLTPDRILSIQTVPFEHLERSYNNLYGHHVQRKKSKSKEPYYDYDEFIKYECSKYATSAALNSKTYSNFTNKSAGLMRKSKPKSKNFLGDIDDESLREEYASAKAVSSKIYTKAREMSVFKNKKVDSNQGPSNRLKSASNARIEAIEAERDHSNSSRDSKSSNEEATSANHQSRRDFHQHTSENHSKQHRSSSREQNRSLSPSKSKSKYEKQKNLDLHDGHKPRQQSNAANEIRTLCKKHRNKMSAEDQSECQEPVYAGEKSKKEHSKSKRSKSKKRNEKEHSSSRIKLSRSRSRLKVASKLKSVSRANVLASFKKETSKDDKSVSPHAHDRVASIQNNDETYGQHCHHHHRHHHRHHTSQHHQDKNHIGCVHAQAPVHYRHGVFKVPSSSLKVKHSSRSRHSSKTQPNNHSRQISPMVPPSKAPPPAPPIDDELFKTIDKNNTNLFHRLNKLAKSIPTRGTDDPTSKSFDAVITELKGKLDRVKPADENALTLEGLYHRSENTFSPMSSIAKLVDNLEDSSKSSFGKLNYVNDSETTSTDKMANETNLSDYLKAEKLKLKSNEAGTSSTNDSDDVSSITNKTDDSVPAKTASAPEQSHIALKNTEEQSQNASNPDPNKQEAIVSRAPSKQKEGIWRREIKVGKGNKFMIPNSELFECPSTGAISNFQNLLSNSKSQETAAPVPISNDSVPVDKKEPSVNKNASNDNPEMRADFGFKNVNPFNMFTDNQIIATNLNMNSLFPSSNSINTGFKIIEKNFAPNNIPERNPSDTQQQPKPDMGAMKKQVTMNQLKSKSAVTNNVSHNMDNYLRAFNSELFQSMSEAKSDTNLALGNSRLIKLPNGIYLDVSGFTGEQQDAAEFDDRFLNPIFNDDFGGLPEAVGISKTFLAHQKPNGPMESQVVRPKFQPKCSGPFRPVQPRPIRPIASNKVPDSRNFSAQNCPTQGKNNASKTNETFALPSNIKVSPFTKSNEKVRETATIKSVANLFKLEVYKDDDDEISEDYNKYNRVKFLPSARNSLNEDAAAKLTALLNDELSKSNNSIDKELSLEEEKLLKSIFQSTSLTNLRPPIQTNANEESINSSFKPSCSHKARILQVDQPMLPRNMSAHSLEAKRTSPSAQRVRIVDEAVVSGAAMRSKSMFNHSQQFHSNEFALYKNADFSNKPGTLAASYSTSNIDFKPRPERESEASKKQKVTAFSTRNLFRSTLTHNESTLASTTTFSTNLDSSISQTSNKSDNRSFNEIVSNNRCSENSIYDLINSIDAEDLITAISNKDGLAFLKDNRRSDESTRSSKQLDVELEDLVSGPKADFLRKLLSNALTKSAAINKNNKKDPICPPAPQQEAAFTRQDFKPIVGTKFTNRSRILLKEETEDDSSSEMTRHSRNDNTGHNKLNSMSTVGFFQRNSDIKSCSRSTTQLEKSNLDNPEFSSKLADAKKNLINEIKSKQALTSEEQNHVSTNFHPSAIPPAPPLPMSLASKSMSSIAFSMNKTSSNETDQSKIPKDLPSNKLKPVLSKSSNRVQESMNFFNRLNNSDGAAKQIGSESSNDLSHNGLLMMVQKTNAENDNDSTTQTSAVEDKMSAFNKSACNLSLINELHTVQKKFNQQRYQPRNNSALKSSAVLPESAKNEPSFLKFHSRSQSNLRTDASASQTNIPSQTACIQIPPPLPLPPVVAQGTSNNKSASTTRVQPGLNSSSSRSNLVQALSSLYQQQRENRSESLIQIKEIKLKSSAQPSKPFLPVISGSNRLATSSSNLSSKPGNLKSSTTACDNLPSNPQAQLIPSKCSSFTNYKSINKVFTNKSETSNHANDSKMAKSQFSAPKFPEKSFENLQEAESRSSKDPAAFKNKSQERLECDKTQSNSRLDNICGEQLSHLSSTYLNCKSLFENLSTASMGKIQLPHPSQNHTSSANVANKQKLSSNSSIERLKNKFESASTTKLNRPNLNNNSSILSVKLKESSPSSLSTSSSSPGNISHQGSSYVKTNPSDQYPPVLPKNNQGSCVNSSSTITTPSGSVNESSSNSSRASTTERECESDFKADKLALNFILTSSRGNTDPKTIVIDNEAKLNEYLQDLASFCQSMNLCHANLSSRNPNQGLNPSNIFDFMVNDSRKTLEERQVYE